MREWVVSVPAGVGVREQVAQDVTTLSPCVPPITSLDLSNNMIGYRGGESLAAILRVRPWHPLRKLNLSNCSLGVIGTLAILDMLVQDARLMDLNIQRNYPLQPEDIRVQNANADGRITNSVFVEMNLATLHVKLLLIWIVNKEIVSDLRSRQPSVDHSNSKINSSSSFSSLLFNGLPSDVLRYIFSFLLVKVQRNVLL